MSITYINQMPRLGEYQLVEIFRFLEVKKACGRLERLSSKQRPMVNTWFKDHFPIREIDDDWVNELRIDEMWPRLKKLLKISRGFEIFLAEYGDDEETLIRFLRSERFRKVLSQSSL